MYIALLIIAFIAGITLFCFFFDRRGIGAFLGLLLFLYGVYAVTVLLSHQTKEDDFAKYEKARTEYEIIKNKCVDISTSTMIDYIDDIKKANDLIEKSKKWHDNWYLKDFYYKEIGELPVLELKDLI